MKYVVTVGTLFIAGQKYRRGDIVDLSAEAAEPHGVRIEPIVEKAPEPNPGVARKTRSRKAAVAQGVSDENS